MQVPHSSKPTEAAEELKRKGGQLYGFACFENFLPHLLDERESSTSNVKAKVAPEGPSSPEPALQLWRLRAGWTSVPSQVRRLAPPCGQGGAGGGVKGCLIGWYELC